MISNIKALIITVKQLVYILDSKQRKKAIAVFFSMIMTSLLELLGVSTIYPFLQAITSPELVKGKKYISWIYLFYPELSSQTLLIYMGVLIMAVFIIKNLVALSFIFFQNKFATEFQRDEATEMLDSYMKRPYQFFVNTNSSELLRGIDSDTNNAYTILLYLFQVMGEMVTVLFLGIFLIKTDWFIAIGSLTIVLLCSLGIILGIKNKMKKAGNDFRRAAKARNQYCYQAINGIKEITVLDRRELFVSHYKSAAQKSAKAALTNAFYSAAPDRILEGICIAGVMGIICIRVIIGIDNDEFIPTIGTFAMGAFKILPSLSKISTRINGIVFNRPGLQSCYENIANARRIDSERRKLECSGENNSLINNYPIHFQNELVVSSISWRYQNKSEDVLHNLSLAISKGESVAFIGTSGSGKTTLADVIMGLLRPQEGKVEVDGIDIFSIPHQWSKIIGYVPQTVYLIDDTIRANVAFGLHKEMVSDEKVWEALEQAQLKSFVEELQNGLDTIVGERGIKFSGGQRQRIAIARALYENPDILVLDEATSALDNETETAVMESIDALHGQKTLIIVAHRLTTIKNCDVIYEIVDGKAIERNKEEVFALA